MNDVIPKVLVPVSEEDLDSCALQLPQTPGYKTGALQDSLGTKSSAPGFFEG